MKSGTGFSMCQVWFGVVDVAWCVE